MAVLQPQFGAVQLEGIEHGGGSAGVVVGALSLARGQQSAQVGRSAGLVVKVPVHARAQLGQHIGKGSGLAAARKVQHLVGAPQCSQAPGHAQQGRDANAAGHQHRVCSVLDQCEVVARRADAQGHAHAQRIVHSFGAAPAGLVLEHADHVAARFAGVVAQRVAAHQSAGQVQVDVGARGKGRQAHPRSGAQVDADDVLGFMAQGVDPGLHGGVGGHEKTVRKKSGPRSGGPEISILRPASGSLLSPCGHAAVAWRLSCCSASLRRCRRSRTMPASWAYRCSRALASGSMFSTATRSCSSTFQWRCSRRFL